MCVCFVCCDFKPSLPTSLMYGCACEFVQILMRYSTCGHDSVDHELVTLFLSAWICPKRQAVPWQAPCTSRPACLRCCVAKRWMAVPPKTPNSTKISQEVNVHYFAPSGKRSTSTTSAHNPTRKPPSPPIKRTTSTTSTRNPGGGGEENDEHYIALNPSPASPLLCLDRPTGPGAH